MKGQPFRKRLGYAIAGVCACWRSEANFRIQFGIALAVFVSLIILNAPPVWWALVGLVIALVLAFELLNSALERLIDHLHPEIHPESAP